MPRRLTAILLALALALLMPALSVAQDPFGGLPQAAEPTDTTPATTSSSGDDDGGGLSGTAEAAIVIVGILAIVAIGVFIARDARRRAPVVEKAPEESKADGKVRAQQHAKQRQRAKAAKAQRKRNQQQRKR